MTRYTSLAYKRTHHEAGFDDDEPATSSAPEKKRKLEAVPAKQGWGRSEAVKAQADKSEQRRQKRIHERLESTVCFACRQKGHAAADCPDSNLVLDNDKDVGNTAAARPATGICYRCGATNYSLKRCRKPENPDDPLPFATCFVCKRKGHLAGKCGQNSKGVYPKGGSCVLCGKTSHLAKDCQLRTQPVADAAVMAATKSVAADEDDFHVFKRKQMRVERAIKVSDKAASKAKQSSSTTSQSQPAASKSKAKVVAF
ncbi:hypothetical protein BKA62DRAFT_4092 [Auriculariales sp. MPI-PUGE-AT-0066]|nr:hypothetical protein BKA62DRAFT_4092 [Auriculariales sp. MPI-PUGE-AT-0066]